MKGSKTPIVVGNARGFSNQVRCALAILRTGNIPVLVKTTDLSKAKMNLVLSEGVDLQSIVRNEFVFSDIRQLGFRPHLYSGWQFAEEDTYTFNAVNFNGLVDLSMLDCIQKVRSEYSDLFYQLFDLEKLDVKEHLEIRRGAWAGIHLRFFERKIRNYTVLDLNTVTSQRHCCRMDWSDTRLFEMEQHINSLLTKDVEIGVATDSSENEFVVKILSNGGFRLNANSGKAELDCLIDIVNLSQAQHLLCSRMSTFGHLAALISTKYKSGRSV